MLRSKRTRACDISPKVRKQVIERDESKCIWCGKYLSSPQLCHYVSRGSGGLGIPENLACGCPDCHRMADQGTTTLIYKKRMKAYLQSQYPHWDNTVLRYEKGYDG